MSGIGGIYNLDGLPIDRSLLSRMCDTLAHYGADGAELWAQGPVGLFCQLLRVTPEASTEVQPLAHSSGPTLVFDGRLDNRAELLLALRNSGDIRTDAPDPDLVLAAYTAFGEGFAARLNGDFALGLFDARRRVLLLARDAIGPRPLYYCQAGEVFLFGSEIKAILAHPLVSFQPNIDVLAELLLNGPAPEHPGATCFTGIYGVPPGFLARVAPEGFSLRRFWDFDTTAEIRLGSFEEYAEAFRMHFKEAVRRRLRSAHPVAITVSGGLDSSSIFCMAETLRREQPSVYPAIRGISYVAPDGTPADEKVYLTEIERQYGVSLVRLPLGSSTRFMDGYPEFVRQVETPLRDTQWKEADELNRTARGLGARILLTGHWGDHLLFDWGYLIDLFHRFQWGTVWAHLNEYPRWFTDTSVNFKFLYFRDLMKYTLPQRIVPWLRRWRSRLAPPHYDRSWFTRAFRDRAFRRANGRGAEQFFASAQAKSLYNIVRSRYGTVLKMEHVAKTCSFQGLEVAHPFLDRDVVAFLLGCPGEIMAWQGVPRRLLRSAMAGILPPAIAWRRCKADFTNLINRGMEQDYPLVEEFFQTGMVAHRLGLVEENKLLAELRQLKGLLSNDESALVSWSIAEVLTLETWLRVFQH